MNKKQTISDYILLTLEKAVDGYCRVEDFSSNTYLYAQGYDRPLKKSALSQSLRRLRLKGLIDLEKTNRKKIFRLTNEGKSAALMGKALSNNKWDGKWRIVIFDIPEKQRKIRDVLRSRLKVWEFKAIQKSVWANKKDITKPLKDFIKEAGIEKWVLVFETTSL